MAISKKSTRDAVKALRARYVEKSPGQNAELEKERLNAEIASLIHQYRKEAGLTQAGLAALVGTTQSVISRLEQADYDGHSLTMLDRIARALNRHVRVEFAPVESGEASAPEPRPELKYAFQEVVKRLRRQRGLSPEQFAERLGVDAAEVLAIEREPSYRPKPLTLYRMSKYFDIPQERLAFLAGAVANVPTEMREHASRFAAKSESFAKLTHEEQQTLDEFVRFLRSDS